jgi:isopentenyl-diphosphate delta-isomerase
MDEVVDLVDPDNQPLRPVSKHAAHREGWLHRTVIGEVRDLQGNIVLVRQAADRQDAGQFVVPVGGHVRAGESEDTALEREAFEEIGLTGLSYRLLGRFIYERHVIGRHENHYFITYQIVLDPTQIVLGPEAVEHRSFAPAELKTALAQTPELFGASYIVLLERYFPSLLPR